jgi:voltage-gated potassium channel
MIIMCIGVCSYSFAVGSLSSVLSSLDSKQAKLKQKLNTLEELRRQYRLNHEIYIKLKKSLKYDHSKDKSDKFSFLNELPQSLKLELAVIMHQNIIKKIPFFQSRDPHFIAFICPLLRPMKVFEDQYIYVAGDQIEESKIHLNYILFLVYFLVSGSASLVLPQHNDLPFITIEPG